MQNSQAKPFDPKAESLRVCVRSQVALIDEERLFHVFCLASTFKNVSTNEIFKRLNGPCIIQCGSGWRRHCHTFWTVFYSLFSLNKIPIISVTSFFLHFSQLYRLGISLCIAPSSAWGVHFLVVYFILFCRVVPKLIKKRDTNKTEVTTTTTKIEM